MFELVLLFILLVGFIVLKIIQVRNLEKKITELDRELRITGKKYWATIDRDKEINMLKERLKNTQ